MADQNAAASLLCSAGLLLFGSQALYASDAEMPPPTLAFLEYLGEWQDDNGQLIDPLVFGKEDTPDNDIDIDGDQQ